MPRSSISCTAVFCVVLALGFPGAAAAQDDDPGWSATAELTGVWTGGNASASTFGLNAGAVREASSSELLLEAGGVRTETVRISRTARGTEQAYTVDEVRDRQRTAESYYARMRYDRRLGEALFAFGAVNWLRNTFSGIESRLLFAGGAGSRWIDTERTRIKTDVGLTYTMQQDVVEDPASSGRFAGLRSALDVRRVLTSTAEFKSVLVADWNLYHREDIRLDWSSSLPVSIHSQIALKPSLQLLWRNEPSLVEIPLVQQDGTPTGAVVTTPLRKVDTFFTLALVVKM